MLFEIGVLSASSGSLMATLYGPRREKKHAVTMESASIPICHRNCSFSKHTRRAMLRTGIDAYKLVFGTAASNPVQLNGLEAQLM